MSGWSSGWSSGQSSKRILLPWVVFRRCCWLRPKVKTPRKSQVRLSADFWLKKPQRFNATSIMLKNDSSARPQTIFFMLLFMHFGVRWGSFLNYFRLCIWGICYYLCILGVIAWLLQDPNLISSVSMKTSFSRLILQLRVNVAADLP